MSDGDSSTNIYEAEIPFLFYKSIYTIQRLPVSYDSNISDFALCEIPQRKKMTVEENLCVLEQDLAGKNAVVT